MDIADKGGKGMGVFWQTVNVGNSQYGDFAEARAMVDTGATDSMFPPSLLSQLRLRPLTSHTYVLANGNRVELQYGFALININGDIRPCPVVFGPGDDALLGATTLEIFKLLADPNTQSLLPASHSPLGGGGPPAPRLP